MRDAVVVGGGVAGLTAALFAARADLDTLVVNHGGSILRRNAHLENFPGFPAGINPRTYLDMLDEQVRRAGADRRDGRVTAVVRDGDGFRVETEDGDERARRVVAASWADADYLDGLPVALRETGHKRFVEADRESHTGVEGLYAAGRLADRYHQAVVAAGDGARAGVSLVGDARPEFYRDWTVPEGYFTNRGREVPAGCEEVSEADRARRERESLAALRPHLAEPRGDAPETHPSLRDGDG
jgi:thioredoxin reductase